MLLFPERGSPVAVLQIRYFYDKKTAAPYIIYDIALRLSACLACKVKIAAIYAVGFITILSGMGGMPYLFLSGCSSSLVVYRA